MVDKLIFGLTLVSALGCGLIAGAFFAFSTFVMNALAKLPPSQGIAAMQSINIAVINPMFMTALFGTGAACLVLVAVSLFRWHKPGAGWLLAGGLVYPGGHDSGDDRIQRTAKQCARGRRPNEDGRRQSMGSLLEAYHESRWNTDQWIALC